MLSITRQHVEVNEIGLKLFGSLAPPSKMDGGRQESSICECRVALLI